ncbi:MAG: sulfatase [Rhodothermales bacterium]
MKKHLEITGAPRLQLVVGCLALLVFGTASCQSVVEKDQPAYNIVFFLVDDMGYADIGPYGNTYHKTPNLDQLAAAGMLFTDAYAAAPNCSPTRASILTGKWPARTGITQYLPGNVLPYAKLKQPALPKGLPLDETIIAEPLKAAGYATASIGKWHLGGGRYAPEARGFDVAFAGGHWNAHERMFAPHAYVDVPDAKEGDYLTDRLTEEAMSFIDDNKDQPFFLYLPYYAIHSPIEAKQDLIDGYAGVIDESGRNNATYAAMVEGVDQSVGRILAQLDQLQLAEQTVVIFFSDNGGVRSRAFNGPFRSGKGFLWEGGIREPLIVRWPGKVGAATQTTVPVTSVDFYPTILEIAGAKDIAGHESDGLSLVPLLEGNEGWSRDAIYWHYPHYSNAGATPTAAIRVEDWKLMAFFEDGHFELFNLVDDPGETTDVSAEEAERTRVMAEKLADWQRAVHAKPALVNPQYDASLSKKAGLRYKAEWDENQPLVNPEVLEWVKD